MPDMDDTFIKIMNAMLGIHQGAFFLEIARMINNRVSRVVGSYMLIICQHLSGVTMDADNECIDMSPLYIGQRGAGVH